MAVVQGLENQIQHTFTNTRNNNKQPNEDKIYHFIPKTTKTVNKKPLINLLTIKALKSNYMMEKGSHYIGNKSWH